MAKVVILGGGFGGVVAAERLAQTLGNEHQITLVSRSRRFIFYPALVRLAFGKCDRDDVSFDLRSALLDRRVNFIESEVARIDPDEQKVIIAHGEVEGQLSYDYLVFALGRRLATEQVTGFYEHAHHLLNVDKAIQFGKAVNSFREGHVVIGQCRGAQLPVPVFETAFAMAQLLEKRSYRSCSKITVVSPESSGLIFSDPEVTLTINKSLARHNIEHLPDFSINEITTNLATTEANQSIDYDLLMLLPPFRGASSASLIGVTNNEGYINVSSTMRVLGINRVYAVGDCVNFDGPKLGHMAVRQAEVAAENLAAEIRGTELKARYSHELKLVIDEGDDGGLFFQKDLWRDGQPTLKQNQFWSWAKWAQEKHWEHSHS
jgi:sulfide:quinone oxidoreductase